MSEDAAAAAGTAEGGAPAETTPAAPAATFRAPAADAGGSPEELLADAVSGESATEGADDLAAKLAKAQADAKKWRDMSRKTEAQAKSNADAAQRLAEIEERDKTEQQRLADRTAAAEKRAADAEGLYHRTLAAATHSLPPSLIGYITGTTEDEASASAETLAAEINAQVAEQVAAQVAQITAAANGGQNGAAQAPAAKGRRPVESMRAGAAPASAGVPATGRNWLAEQYLALKGQQ